MLLFATADTQAWDHVTLPAAGLTADFVPELIATPDANGFWTLGYDAGGATLVRYSTAGTPLLVRYPQPDFQDGATTNSPRGPMAAWYGFMGGFCRREAFLAWRRCGAGMRLQPMA